MHASSAAVPRPPRRLSRSNVSRADMWAIAALVSLQYGIAIDGPGSYTPPSLKLEAFK